MKDTLDRIPKEKGIDVRAELLKFHGAWYSADIMTLAVCGKESLDELEALVTPLFSAIEEKGVTAPTWPEAPFPPELRKKRAYCMPVKDLRSLSIDFPVPDSTAHYKSAPGHYLSHLLGHEGPGSLLAALKARGWCNSLVGGTRIGARGFGFFGVQVDLTEDGIEHIDDIIELVFQYISLLRSEGPVRWVWEEQRDLASTEFRFKDTQEPRSLVTSHVHLIQQFPMEDVLSAYYIMSEWRPDLIEELLNLLTPENVRVGIVAKAFADKCTMVEPWYGTKYLQEDIDEETIKKWKNTKHSEELHLPPPNEYIPANLDIDPSKDPTQDSVAPCIVRDSALLRLWYKRDHEFLLPKAVATFDFISPLAYSEPLSCGLASLWVLLLRDKLQQGGYAAELAGLRGSVGNAKYGLSVTIDGYDDKQHILLDKIIDELVNFKCDPKSLIWYTFTGVALKSNAKEKSLPSTLEKSKRKRPRFEIMKENHIRAIKNFDAEQPYQHAVYQQALCLSELAWTKGQLLEAAEAMTPEMLNDFAHRFMRKVHVEGLIYGNVSRERALRIATRLEEKLPKDAMPLLAQQLLLHRDVELDKGSSYLRIVNNSVHKSSCASLYYACGGRAPREHAALELCAQLVAEPAFTQLRTKEQLGYIVFSGVRRSNGTQGLRLIVQGDRHSEYLEERIEAFLHTMEAYIRDMPEEEFIKHRSSLAAQKLERPKRMSSAASQLWSEITTQFYNFDRARVEVEQLQTISKDELLEFFMRHISADSDSRRKLSVRVVATAGADPEPKDATEKEEKARPTLITDLVEFKSRRSLHPHPAPHTNIPRKGAHCKL
ncbi:hypothetical protein JYU34_017951 [Plutella xylostella]|uniref:Insulin-degrading enzyme n=1 Tax=Plutella xylostella TaxID=51655 RepID=A0ABQ7PZE1_PLUXY|nr:hypothetical protein JYU34_017951 [Plutella xylostella]